MCIRDRFQIFYPDSDYLTKNMYVKNKNVDMGSLRQEDWYELAMIAMGRSKGGTKKKSTTNQSTVEKRQQWHRDFGFSSQMNTSRRGSDYGVACPKFKGMSDEEAPLVTRAVVQLSKLVRSSKFEWLPRNQKPYTSNDDRSKLFAETWDKDCVLEYMRINVTVSDPKSVVQKCDVHLSLIHI